MRKIQNFQQNDIMDLTPNSVFNSRLDITKTNYYTTEDFNTLQENTASDNIFLLHLTTYNL